MQKKWILNMDISFAFNGTEEDAREKLKEDMQFLEDNVFTRDTLEYIINNSEICKAKN
jgi:hypothetical protein|tara:strand:+ start:35792 stop:35965 length:174 start_codon:yes stop_codon:yes gene_type:complete